ncbi:D-serine dehydratase [Fusarium acutatum]|uniref:D-serine dehydratase n=1 Tax=Fusarium acutatum TaxID=78861 RepID=A0A8H4NIZ4_9HYPO|nr:D-serine dehydratase [Fusarium acutatum]
MDHSLEHHRAYVGKSISQLPTPSLVVSLPILQRNIARLHQDVSDLGIGFRPHTLEITRLMLANGRYRSVVASTLAEIRGVLPLVHEGVLDECLYGMPVYPGALPALQQLRKSIDIQLMVDNEQQITCLDNSPTESTQPWEIFIKIDVGSRRAGIQPDSSSLCRLVAKAEESRSVNIAGFYCHAGHSYAGRSPAEAEKTLQDEISGVLSASKLLPATRKLWVSVGSTPTAHVVKSLKAALPANIELELHAGMCLWNFPTNDLQQVSTGVISESDQAVRVVAEVCSVYPDRNEALINAGVVALSRETSAFPGFGYVVGRPEWNVVRLSQEHGILGTRQPKSTANEAFAIGQRDDVVIDCWVPWKGCM